MTYKVLYRKYRPQSFNDLYGQDSIKTLLKQAIIKDKISHAYIFNGPRGTGKTSTAKLFAKTINCEKPQAGIPCNKCITCLNYENSPDIIEIDAASNNGVDEIRELRENAKVMPTFSKYKVYIIDEVHMLSQSAWNAFLKILEEPPKHVVFILATTEIQKIPITILSRCQRFTFKKIAIDDIYINLKKICENENILAEAEALKYIAEMSDGGMRDSLSVLDQLSKENDNITIEMIQNYFGIIPDDIIYKIIDSLQKGNISEFETTFSKFCENTTDINMLIKNLIEYLYKLTVENIINKQTNISIDKLHIIIRELSECFNKKSTLELIKIILIDHLLTQEVEEIIKNESQNITEETKSKEQNSIKNASNLEKLIRLKINNAFVNPSKQLKEEFINNWDNFINKIKISNRQALLSIVEDINIEVVSEKNIIFSSKSTSNSILFNENVNQIEQEYLKYSGKTYSLVCINKTKWNEIKENYKKNKNKKYEYISENIDSEETNIIATKAQNIFENIDLEIS